MHKVTAIKHSGPYVHYEYDDGSHMVVEKGVTWRLKKSPWPATLFWSAMIALLITLFVIALEV